MRFKDSKQFLKGKMGEELVDKYLMGRNIIPYHPVFEGAHPFDRICASTDKKKVLIVEVKTKAMRKYYPDTGFNIRSYNEYKYVSKKYNIPIFIFFVDEKLQEVYGNYLHELDKRYIIEYEGKKLVYPKKENNIIYFSMKLMIRDICGIKSEITGQLKELSCRNHEY